jgi:hypothetical protein
MRGFNAIILSAFALPAHAQVANPSINMLAVPPSYHAASTVPQHVPMHVMKAPQTVTQRRQFQDMGNAPDLTYITAGPAQNFGGLKKTARPKDQPRGLDSKASLKEGRVPGADGYGAEKDEKVYGRFGMEGKEVADRVGYDGGVKYGPKAVASRKTPKPAMLTSQTFEDMLSIPIGALMALIVAGGLTLRMRRFRLASSTPAKEPLLATFV